MKMANKRSNTYTQKRVNPLQRPKGRIKGPRVGFDGTTLSCTAYLSAPGTVGGEGKGAITVDCSSVNFTVAGQMLAGASTSMASVTQLYSQYNYKSLSVEYVPNIGPSNSEAGSRIHIAYLDSPEKMVTWRNATSNILNLVRGCRNVRSFNAWERFTYRTPLSWRRKEFDVNTNAGVVVDVDEYERSVQGLVLIVVESAAAGTVGSLGTFKLDSQITLRQLNLSILT